MKDAVQILFDVELLMSEKFHWTQKIGFVYENSLKNAVLVWSCKSPSCFIHSFLNFCVTLGN